jgi:hypothetical protein
MSSPAAHQRHRMVPVAGAWLQVFGADRRIHLTVARVAHDQPVFDIPQSEAFRETLDRVEQAMSLAVDCFLSQRFVGTVADEDEISLDRAIGVDIGLVDAPGIAVAEPRRVQPALPFDSLAGKRTLAKPLQLFVVLLAKDLGHGLADDLLGLHAEALGLLAIDVEVAKIAADERNARRDRVQDR